MFNLMNFSSSHQLYLILTIHVFFCRKETWSKNDLVAAIFWLLAIGQDESPRCFSCVRACVCACVYACVRVCVCACVRVCACNSGGGVNGKNGAVSGSS